MQHGFIDLRQNDGRLVDDSFWPSFTDVMTVIVMIFLIATTVLIVKNWDLVNELQQRIVTEQEISSALKQTIVEKNKTHDELLASIEAKNQISEELEASIEALQRTNEIAEQNQAENITLEERLQHAESSLALMKLKLKQADTNNRKNTLIIAQHEKNNQLNQLAIDSLQKDKDAINKQLQQKIILIGESQEELDKIQKQLKLKQNDILILEKAKLETEQQMNSLTLDLTHKQQNIVILKQQLSDSKLQVDDLLSQKSNVDKRLLAAQNKLLLLNASNREKEAVLEELKLQIDLAEQQKSEQQDKFDDLQKKYNKLVRPARSTIGKYVVEVRYEKVDNLPRILLKDASDDKFRQLSKNKMHQHLAQLKKEYGNRLYVKVIIPEQSGLSYNEAWQFMQQTLNSYDYYYQGENRL